MSVTPKTRYFIQQYTQVCQQTYGKLGFVRYKKTFVRIIGDIVQSFSLIIFPNRSACTVAFSIQPLCRGIAFHLDPESYQLDQYFYDDEKVYYCGWEIQDSPENVSDCLASMLSAINTYVIPSFDRATNVEAALCETLRIELELDILRRQHLELMRVSDKAMPWLKSVLFDYNRYWMALKSHNTIYVRLYLENQLDNAKKRLMYSMRLASADNKDPDYFRQLVSRDELSVNKAQAELDRFLANDMAYFDNLVAINEEVNIAKIAQLYPKLLKQMTTG